MIKSHIMNKQILIIIAAVALIGCGKKGDYREPEKPPTQTVSGIDAEIVEVTTKSGTRCVVVTGYNLSSVAVSCDWK